VLAGPSPDVVDLDGVAMAPDGTGGVVYRERVGGVPHIFAARLFGGRWQPPQRVDAGQAFASSWPRIAAARSGTLRVVWVQEYGPGTDRLYAATAAGGGGFGTPWLVDANIGEATATWPALASEPGGRTYLAYRVLGLTGQTGNPPPGYVAGQIRLARYKGPGWESLGIAARNPATFVPTPSADNQPRLTVSTDGNAVVAWQEPDDNFVDRVWARRIFSSGLGIPLPASPDAPGAAADAFDLAGGDFGVATVVSRVVPAGGGAPQLYVDSLPSMFDQGAAAFAGARPLGAAASGLGAPAVSTDGTSAWTATAAVGPEVLLGAGDDQATGTPARIDDGSGSGDAAPVVAAGAAGASVAAWRLTRGASSGVALRVTDLRGRRDAAVLSSPAGGPVDELAIAGSGLGDALVAFRQGGDGDGAIAVSTVDGPPQAFRVVTPADWVRPRHARVSWEPALDAFGGVRYALVIDGVRQPSQRGLSRLPFHGRLDDGAYRVTVIATDARGQQTVGQGAVLRVDGTPPSVRVSLRGRRLLVRAGDGRRGRVAGVAGGGVHASFGDGTARTGGARLAHRYRRAGRYRVRVAARDRAGNRVTVVRTVVVR
jgi:hypothetical protein